MAWKTVWWLLKNKPYSYHMSQPFYSYVFCWEKWKHMHINCVASLSVTTPTWKQPTFLNIWIERQSVVYQFNGMLWNNKKGSIIDTRNNLGKCQSNHAVWKNKSTYRMILFMWNPGKYKLSWQKTDQCLPECVGSRVGEITKGYGAI